MEKSSTIIITGGTGLIGSALKRHLEKEGFENVLAVGSHRCDLTDWEATRTFFEEKRPDYVFHLAARVFGIMGNMSNKGISFYDNIRINTNVIEACRLAGVKKITAMGSGCVYPFPAPHPDLKEEMVWQGPPHPSEDSYAHSKRAMLAQLVAYKEQYDLDYAFVISGNLYGPGDSYDAVNGHVIPALVYKFHEAASNGGEVTIWGDGSAQRDFTYSEDAARAVAHIMEHLEGAVNMGSGHIHPIRDIVTILAKQTNLQDRVVWDSSKPNGQLYRAYDLRKLMNSGFQPQFDLASGLKLTYDWYAEHHDTARKGGDVA